MKKKESHAKLEKLCNAEIIFLKLDLERQVATFSHRNLH